MRTVCFVVILAAVLNAQEVVPCAGGTPIDVPAVKTIDESKVPLVHDLKKAPHVGIVKTGSGGSWNPDTPFPDALYLWYWDGRNWQALNNTWTCEDQDRAIMTSVNGMKHWCHKETPE